MQARLIDLLYINPRHCRLTVDLMGDFRKEFESLKESEVEVSVSKYRPPRSLNANSYAWVLIHRIAEKTHEPPIDIYKRLIRDVGCKVVITCVKAEDAELEIRDFVKDHIGRTVMIGDSKFDGYVTLHKKYGSSDFTTSQMAAFIDNIVEACRELEIETRPAEEIESLLGEWK